MATGLSAVDPITANTTQYIYPDSWTALTNAGTNYAAGIPAYLNDVYQGWYDGKNSTGQTLDQTTAINRAVNPDQGWASGIRGALSQGDLWKQTNNSASSALTPWSGVLGSAQDVANRAASGFGAGSVFDPSQLQKFMSPYVNDAANSLITQSNRNLTENILPGVNSTFTGAGQFGSSRNADFTNRAIRDQQQGLNTALGQLNYGATKDAMGNYSDWANKLISGASGLNAVAGTLGNIGSGYGGLSGAYNALGNGALSFMNTIGGLNSTGSGVDNTQNQTALTAANAGQVTQQQALDKDYQDWLTQQQFPLTGLSALSSGVGGLSSGVKPNSYVPSSQPDNLTRLITAIQTLKGGVSDSTIQTMIQTFLGGN